MTHFKNVLIPFKKPKAWSIPGLLVLSVGVLGVFSQPGFAQSDWDVQNRVKRLENEVQTLSRAVYRGEEPPPGSLDVGGQANADTEIRLQQFESEIQDMRGTIERQNFEIRQLKEQLERVTSDMELRLKDLEGGKTGSADGASSSSSSSSSSTINTVRPRYTAGGRSSDTEESSSGSGYQWKSGSNNRQQLGSYTENAEGDITGGADDAASMYDNAFSLIKARNYDQAQVEFDAFLKAYPDSELAGNAQYWLGETHYVRGDYDKAARIFAEGYKKYPKSSKLADNLLKLGLSLDALGKSADACTALRQLKKENPAGAAPVLRRADQEMSRLSCEA